MFENRVLRKIFGPNRGELAGGQRRMHNVKLHNLQIYGLPNIIRVIISRKMGEEHVACIGEVRNAYKTLV
jgi:hypothetical protein